MDWRGTCRPAVDDEWILARCKERYAWPGGYPMYAICNDGYALCCDCAPEWIEDIVGIDINWEDPYLYCAHCGTPIESAYGDPDNES